MMRNARSEDNRASTVADRPRTVAVRLHKQHVLGPYPQLSTKNLQHEPGQVQPDVAAGYAGEVQTNGSRTRSQVQEEVVVSAAAELQNGLSNPPACFRRQTGGIIKLPGLSIEPHE